MKQVFLMILVAIQKIKLIFILILLFLVQGCLLYDETSSESSLILNDSLVKDTKVDEFVDITVESDRPCGDNCPMMEMILIQAGSFNMGSNTNSSEQPIHNVQIRRNFYVAKTEVTVGQYRTCVSAGQCTAPDGTENSTDCNWTSSVGTKENHPVNCVDWNQARTFAKWIGGDLLTEAQWEYVATAQGQEITYPWGNAEPTCQLANHGYCVGSIAPVCSTTGGNTTQGVCDMGGNVWEWLLDEWHDSYSRAPSDDIGWCSNKTCDSNISIHRVLHGGSWSGNASGLRSASRTYTSFGNRYNYLGFRVSDTHPMIP